MAANRGATLADRFHQLGLWLAFQSLRAIWFLTRPKQHGALVLIWHDGRFLLLRNSYQPQWSLPGGTVERGEHSADAASRELREEIGLQVSSSQLAFCSEITLPHHYRSDRVELFEWRPFEKPSIWIDHREVIETRWVTADEAERMPLIPHLALYLRQAGMRG